MSKANGATDADIEAQYQNQALGYRLATKVQVTSDAEVARHAAKFPELSDRFVSVPWFRPGLIAAPASTVRQKHLDDKRLRLVFVGRQARRKGLDIVLDALRLMSDAERKRLSFDIVTSFSDGPVDLNVDVELRVHREIDNKSLFELMRNAHIYVMPCRFETFGLVFVEAMSHGCGVLAPDWEVQREILDYGRAGVNATPTAEEVCRGFRTLCQDREKRTELAEAALQRFEEKYSPKAVAAAYNSMFEMAIAAKRAKGRLMMTPINLFIFIIAALGRVSVNLIGELYVSEIILLLAILHLGNGFAWLLKNRTFNVLMGFAGLWLLNQMITDVYRATPFEDWTRGWAKSVFFMIDFTGVALLTRFRMDRIVIFFGGIAFSFLLQTLFFPNSSQSEGEFADGAWKFGIGAIFQPHRARYFVRPR